MIGRTISHYRITAQLGSGGMGVVYEAEDLRLGRHVALKLLPADACADPQAMDRFLREARIISSLTHPHICTLHDIGEHEGRQFMVMELLEGEPLTARITRGPLPLDDLLDIGVQIADALDAAHAAGIVHRDIKPANLFLTRRSHVKVLDFGVAKLGEGAGDAPDLALTMARSELTTTGSAIGTVAYMSPEQARGQAIDARSDLFSFGNVLYEMATGRQTFPGATQAVMFEGILTRQPVPPSQLNATIPPELDRIVGKALEKDRELRYQSASEIRADLKRLRRETDTGRTVPASVAATGTGTSAAVGPAAQTIPSAVQPPASAAPPPAASVPARSRRRAVIVGAPLVTAALIAGGLMWQSQRTPALAERDTVVLAELRNRTGDTMFDDTLSEALAVQLRQSPFLNLLPEQQVQATLRLMGREPDESITPEIGQEICQRAGGKAVLGGTIASLGNTYVLTLNAQDCVNGAIVAEEQVNAKGKDEVITALGGAASRFREKLGESLASVQRYNADIEEATTRSLEALKAYSQGMTTRRTRGDFDSVPFFRRAVELDPDFALAHARLGTVLSNLGESAGADKAARRAYELRDKVSERERLYIEARYYTTAVRDQARAIESYRLLLATYPDDYAARANVGALYRNRGMLAEAITNLEESVRIAPGQPLGHLNLGGAYFDLGRLAEARRQFEEAIAILDTTSARRGLFVVAMLTGDRPLADAQVEAVRGRRDDIDMISARAQAAAYYGRFKESFTLVDELVRRAQAVDRLDNGAEGLLSFAIYDAVVGHADAARRELARVQTLNIMSDGATDEVLLLAALLGDQTLARAYVDRALQHAAKSATAEDRVALERSVQTYSALAAGRNQVAYEHAAALAGDPRAASAAFVGALAATRLQRWNDAIAMMEPLLQVRGKIGLSPFYAAGRITLARAYAGGGRTAEARKAYEEVLALWKDADPDVPLLLEARREYERLAS